MITKVELANKAFTMFRDFTKNVKRFHADANLDILDEGVLVRDLLGVIKKARKALLVEEKEEERSIDGYSVGFMRGYIAGNLSIHWVHEYIIKQSQDYKVFIAMKSMRLYLELDTVAAIKSRSIYHHLLSEGSNLSDMVTGVKPVELDKWLADESESFPTNEILQILQNKEHEYIKAFLKKDYDQYLISPKGYFTDGELLDIINYGVLLSV